MTYYGKAQTSFAWAVAFEIIADYWATAAKYREHFQSMYFRLFSRVPLLFDFLLYYDKNPFEVIGQVECDRHSLGCHGNCVLRPTRRYSAFFERLAREVFISVSLLLKFFGIE